jgi:hypothetical protein
MRGFAICRNEGGSPNIGELDYSGFVLVAHYGHVWGLYLFAGTPAQLAAINAAPNVVGMCTLANVNTVVSSAFRTQVNPWLTANVYPIIPVGWTYRQVIVAICERLIPEFDMDNKLYIAEAG